MTPTPVHTSGVRSWLPRPLSLNPRLTSVRSWLPRPLSLNRKPTLSRPHPNHQRTQGNRRAHAPRAPPRPPPRDATLRRRPAPAPAQQRAQQQRHGPRDFKRVPYLQHATLSSSAMADATSNEFRISTTPRSAAARWPARLGHAVVGWLTRLGRVAASAPRKRVQ